ncbi:unnamed protein product [Brassica oleracea var. botrytis]
MRLLRSQNIDRDPKKAFFHFQHPLRSTYKIIVKTTFKTPSKTMGLTSEDGKHLC